jgi:tetratricopeptide (TPR) repeat protein
MSTEAIFQRGQLLFEQGRREQAAEQFRQVLSQEPNDANAHAFLALCLLENKDQWREATREAELAVGLAPDQYFAHYVLAVSFEKRNHFEDALKSIDSALSINPYVASIYGLKASVLLQQRRWGLALDAAEAGLEVDAENETCLSLRSIALEKLGRVGESVQQAEQTVAQNPDSTYAHSTRGWALLQSGQYRKAAESFREALRLGPTNEAARTGMIHALNNHFFVFRMVYRFYAFMGRLANHAQWMIILGLFVGMQLLKGVARANPAFEPFVTPITYIYLSFCILTWTATPLFNAFLRLHPFGKYLLSGTERLASSLVAGLLLFGVLAGIVASFLSFDHAFLSFILPVFLAMMIAAAFEMEVGWPRNVGFACAGVFALGAVVSVVGLFAGWQGWSSLFVLLVIGFVGYQFLANYLKTVMLRH